MILVDTSIWIKYFNSDEQDHLTELILEDSVIATNDIILTELIPFLKHHKAYGACDSLNAIDKFSLDINWEAIQMLQLLNLKNGVNKVGLPGLIIAQNAMQNGAEIWTNDKHFRLMANFTNLQLYQG